MKASEIKWKAFLASVLFHIVLIASLVVGLPYSEDPTDAVEISITLLEDDAVEAENPATEAAKVVARSAQKAGKNRIAVRKAKNGPGKGGGVLFPSLDLSSASSKAVNANVNSKWSDNPEGGGRFSFQDPRSYDTDIGDIFGDSGNENWAHFKEIYTKVDSNLNFDSILAQYNHFGRVYVQFELDENGILKTENLKVDAKDSILKVHVLRAIKKSFNAENSLLNSAKGEKALLYHARFDFNFGNYQQNFSKQREFGRPVFSFRRFTEEKPVPEELLEQLLTGGVSPNISSMYERWQKYNQKKRRKAVEFDPFSSYKNDPFYSL